MLGTDDGRLDDTILEEGGEVGIKVGDSHGEGLDELDGSTLGEILGLTLLGTIDGDFTLVLGLSLLSTTIASKKPIP